MSAEPTASASARPAWWAKTALRADREVAWDRIRKAQANLRKRVGKSGRAATKSRRSLETSNYQRWYRPNDGRYLSPDPIGLAGGEAGYFGYVGSNPLVVPDPSGLGPDPGNTCFGGTQSGSDSHPGWRNSCTQAQTRSECECCVERYYIFPATPELGDLGPQCYLCLFCSDFAPGTPPPGFEGSPYFDIPIARSLDDPRCWSACPAFRVPPSDHSHPTDQHPHTSTRHRPFPLGAGLRAVKATAGHGRR
jgi:RHS repeat-associated protein